MKAAAKPVNVYVSETEESMKEQIAEIESMRREGRR
jgi:hypothetical protein